MIGLGVAKWLWDQAKRHRQAIIVGILSGAILGGILATLGYISYLRSSVAAQSEDIARLEASETRYKDKMEKCAELGTQLSTMESAVTTWRTAAAEATARRLAGERVLSESLRHARTKSDELAQENVALVAKARTCDEKLAAIIEGIRRLEQ